MLALPAAPIKRSRRRDAAVPEIRAQETSVARSGNFFGDGVRGGDWINGRVADQPAIGSGRPNK